MIKEIAQIVLILCIEDIDCLKESGVVAISEKNFILCIKDRIALLFLSSGFL